MQKGDSQASPSVSHWASWRQMEHDGCLKLLGSRLPYRHGLKPWTGSQNKPFKLLLSTALSELRWVTIAACGSRAEEGRDLPKLFFPKFHYFLSYFWSTQSSVRGLVAWKAYNKLVHCWNGYLLKADRINDKDLVPNELFPVSCCLFLVAIGFLGQDWSTLGILYTGTGSLLIVLRVLWFYSQQIRLGSLWNVRVTTQMFTTKTQSHSFYN